MNETLFFTEKVIKSKMLSRKYDSLVKNDFWTKCKLSKF